MARARKFNPRRRMKRAPRRPRTTLVNKVLSPIAQRYICKLKYAQSFPMTLAAGTNAANTQWSLNSINNPFTPGGTGNHQPYGHDQLSTLYNRYRVISTSYNLTAYNATNPTEPIQLCVVPSNDTITFTAGQAARESPRARYVMIPGTGAPLRVIKGKAYLPSLTGRTKSQYMADDRYQAQFGSSPLEIMPLNVCAALITDAAAGVDRIIWVNIELVYHVECFDLKQLAQS